MARTGTTRSIAVFSLLGSGSGDELRIVRLTADLCPELWPFDRSRKLRSALRLLQLLRRRRPDLLVMEGTGVAGGLVVLIGRHLLRTPYVVSSGDAVGPFIAMMHPALGPLGYLYELVLCRSCSGFIGWTPYLVGRALTLGAPRAVTAANWASPEAALGDGALIRAQLGIPPNAIVFGIVGSQIWDARGRYCYGLELVQAIKKTRRDDVHALLVGDGKGRARLEAEARGANVHVVGHVPRDALGPYLAAMDVASLPQSLDGVGTFRYSTKLSEYLAAGLPVVTGQLPFAYDLGGSWLWRLPGDAPWTPVYIDAMARLMDEIDADDVARHRAEVPRNHPMFDGELQRSRVGEFLYELLGPESAPVAPVVS